MKENIKFLGVTLIAMFALILATSFSTNNISLSEESKDGINYEATVCRQITRADGTIEPTECSHNLLTNAGANASRDLLGNVGGAAFDWIGLCNASITCATPAITDTTLSNEITTGGLDRAQGTYAVVAGAGNWTISKTFTADSDNILTNSTGLFNATSGGTMLAENSFTLATLQTDDTIALTWQINLA